MRKVFLTVLLMFACFAFLNAQTTRDSSHVVPTGKGWGVDASTMPGRTLPRVVTQGNGISYHGGSVLKGNPVHVYFIWYGNWTNGTRASDSQVSVSLLDALFGSSGGIGGSGYEKINTTYGDNSGNVSGNVSLTQSTTDNYSHGTRLSDSAVKAVVSSAITSGRLPTDTNALYFVLTSSDVRESSGFCSQYCGWHTNGSINGADIKYSFVGNPDRCPSACEMGTVSPNGDSGADDMASIMAHEMQETLSDPDLNA